jgi:acetylornithine aminotransferase
MNVLDREAEYFFHTYKRLPLEIDRGEGVYLYTKDGKRYLDMFAGLAVNALGYGHPGVVAAITEQSRRYTHLSNYFLQEPQLQLAEQLVRLSGYAKVFLSNSGTESIEGTIKIARKWGSSRGKTDIVSFSNGFHGRTMGALSIMDKPLYKDGYGPFLENCRVAPFNDLEGLRKAVTASTAAVVLEFIQGEGGVCPVTPEFAAEIQSLREKFGFLLVADEIQSGIGRTGRFFGFQHFDATPDIIVVAKPIGGGLPLGAIIGSSAVAGVLSPGMHGTTFGGNPVACAAGLVVLRELTAGGVMKNAEAMGALLLDQLRALQREFPAVVKEVRGYGLMVGMELARECDSVVKTLRERGVLVNGTNVSVLRFLPPLIIQKEHVDLAVHELRMALKNLDSPH